MIVINNKEDCCGCTACYNICPQKAIKMMPDEEGFLYPTIDHDKCVNCGLCDKICPVKDKDEHQEDTKAYIFRYRKPDIVEQSTSGGLFTAIAELFLDKQAVIYGTGYDEDMNVICKSITSKDGLQEMRGSKFVQSDLGNSFFEIKKQLKSSRIVVFSGTPCQVAGLLSYLGGKPDNLFCIDFVCRGVPSPGLWKNYVNMMEKKYKSKMIGARFKNKTYGYHASTMKIDFTNGKTWYGSGRIDPFMKAFVKELASRPSCAACAFKGTERFSDVTMFDCYEFSQITGRKDDNKGWSSALVHTDMGKRIFEELKSNSIIIQASLKDIITENGIMVQHSAKPNEQRENFYQLVASMPIDQAMDRIMPISKKDRIIEFSKRIFYKLGLITVFKPFKKNEGIKTVD